MIVGPGRLIALRGTHAWPGRSKYPLKGPLTWGDDGVSALAREESKQLNVNPLRPGHAGVAALPCREQMKS